MSIVDDVAAAADREHALVIARKEIGRRMAQRRAELDATQWDVASLVGVGRPTYAQYEQGHLDMPLSKFLMVCVALQTTPGYLLGQLDDADARLTEVTRLMEKALLVAHGDQNAQTEP